MLLAQPDARELVRQSIKNGEASWRQSFAYACIKDDIDRAYDPSGKVKSVDDDVYRIVPLGYATSFEMHVKHDNEPVPASTLAQEKKNLAAREAESPAEKTRRFEKLKAQRSYMEEVPDAFDFKITGTQNLPTGPAWVITATPHPGYQARSRYAHMFPCMRGTLWIDKKDVQWVKADALATDTVAFGFFIARLAKGSHIVLEQMKLPDGSWVPKRIMARAHARMFVFWNHNFEEDITYSHYQLPANLARSAKAPAL